MYQLILSTCFLISVSTSIVFVVRCTLWFCITKNPMTWQIIHFNCIQLHLDSSNRFLILLLGATFIACPTETAHGCRVRLPLWFDLRVWGSCEKKREKKALIVGSQVRTLPNLGKPWQIHANHPESSENMSGCHRVPWVKQQTREETPNFEASAAAQTWYCYMSWHLWWQPERNIIVYYHMLRLQSCIGPPQFYHD